jgi:signal transduction histidine kinase
MLIVMSYSLKEDLTRDYLEANTQRAENLTHQISNFLNTRRIQIETQASNPVVQQTVMRSKINEGLISDYFNDYRIIGKQYAQQLYNFRGKIVFNSTGINASHKNINIDLLTKSDFSNIFDALKTTTYQIDISHDIQYISLYLPVYYGEAIEGVLATHIPIIEISDALNLDTLQNISILVRSQSGTLITWGEPKSSDWKSVKARISNIKIMFTINLSNLNNSFRRAQNKLIVSAVLISCFSIFLAVFLGRWLFVKPLLKLQDFTEEVSSGVLPHLDETKRITIEVQQLADKITDMARRIRRREQDLIASNEILKKNQDSLVHAEKMAGLGQVTAGVAHEINNPVGFIMNNLTVLQEYHEFLSKLITQFFSLKEHLSEEACTQLKLEIDAIEKTLKEEDIDFVLNDLRGITSESIVGAERVKDITQGLKGYAYSGELTALTDINDCIESTLKMVWNELKYHCKIEKELANIPQIECMGGQINQVLMNLFINAAHAMEGTNGVLGIQTLTQSDTIQIRVSDNGKGIEDEHLSHIFEPFFTTKPVGQGTGLGMSICYDIIKKHHGTINVESVLGEGTTFTITLPIDAHE